MKAHIYNLQNESVGTVELPETVFGRKWNPDLVYQAVRVAQANRRKPIAHTKGRGEVRGGGVKPWRQKHTGRARHGSIRSPLWKGGGVTHGPTKERDFSLRISKQMKSAALYCVLSQKLREGELRIIDSLAIATPKTKEAVRMLKLFPSALLVPEKTNKMIIRAARNIPKTKSIAALSLNVEDALRFKHVLIEKAALVEIKTR